MNQQTKDPGVLAAKTIKCFLGMFPTMDMMSDETAKLYSNELAAAIASNKDVNHTELRVGIDYLRSGQYKSRYAPSIPEFMAMCKTKVNKSRYFERLAAPVKTDEQKATAKEFGQGILDTIKQEMNK